MEVGKPKVIQVAAARGYLVAKILISLNNRLSARAAAWRMVVFLLCPSILWQSGRTASVADILSEAMAVGNRLYAIRIGPKVGEGIMWSAIEDIIEIAAAVLGVVAAVLAVTAKVWRVPQVINRIVESNVLERLEAMLTKNDLALKEGDRPPIRKRVG